MRSSRPGSPAGYWIAAAMLLTIACGCAGAAAASLGPNGATPAPLQALMQTRIDSAADTLWDAVALIVAERGEGNRGSPTSAKWQDVRQSAQALVEAASELSIPGQRVTVPGQPPRAPAGSPGEIDAPSIQRRIDADPMGFVRLAQALGSASQKALAAIDTKDADGLAKAGGLIDAACESCHALYWYPQQRAGGP